MNIPGEFLVHIVTVTPPAAESSTGLVPGTPFELECFAERKRRMVRNAMGDTVLSDLTLYTAPGQADIIPVGSTITWGSDVGNVISVSDHDSGGLGAPDHTEVNCG